VSAKALFERLRGRIAMAENAIASAEPGRKEIAQARYDAYRTAFVDVAEFLSEEDDVSSSDFPVGAFVRPRSGPFKGDVGRVVEWPYNRRRIGENRVLVFFAVRDGVEESFIPEELDYVPRPKTLSSSGAER
jgi:transcription antitermination factor NusG